MIQQYLAQTMTLDPLVWNVCYQWRGIFYAQSVPYPYADRTVLINPIINQNARFFHNLYPQEENSESIVIGNEVYILGNILSEHYEVWTSKN